VIILLGVLYFYKYKVTPDVELSQISIIKSEKVDRLDEYLGNNLLICFYSSTCGPCMKELPILNSLNTELKEANFEILALTMSLNGGNRFGRNY